MELCKYGDKCFRKGNAKHMGSFRHEPLPETTQDDLQENQDPVDQRRESLETKPSKKRKPNSPETIEPVTESDDGNRIDLKKIKDLKSLVLEYNSGMQLPEDFYELLEFCKTNNPNDPKSTGEREKMTKMNLHIFCLICILIFKML
jgi:hypothetical protein